MKAAAFSLLVLTLNVAGPRRVHHGWPTRLEALTARLRAEAPDTLALQEVWRGEDVAALADATGLPHRAHEPRLGLAVASRRPIESFRARDLGEGGGALRARLREGKTEFDVYSARLEPGEGAAAWRRWGQLFRLAEFVRAESSTRPFALLGDLGTAPEERDAELFLDLLEARDLCVSHGDEVCGRTRDDRRVDFVLIPYASRAPRENARTTFTDLAPEENGALPASRFGLAARLDASFLRLKPAAEPPGRDQALTELIDALERARGEIARRGASAGWVPFSGVRDFTRVEEDGERLLVLEEELRSAQARDARRAAAGR